MKGIRVQTICVMVFVVFLGGALLYTSQATQDADQVLARLKADITGQNEAIQLLEAEWAYLNSPQRLEKLALEFYGVKTPSASQMIDGREDLDLPFPVPLNARPHDLVQPVSYGATSAEDVR